MRLLHINHITGDELSVSNIDLISRAKINLVHNIGEELLSRYPSLVEVEQDIDTGDTSVKLDFVIFSTADFHAGIEHLSEVLDSTSFTQLCNTMNLKELKNEKN